MLLSVKGRSRSIDGMDMRTRPGSLGAHPCHDSTFRPSKPMKSVTFLVTRISRLTWAVAAIIPSGNAGVLPKAIRRARSAACQAAASASYGNIGTEARTTFSR